MFMAFIEQMKFTQIQGATAGFLFQIFNAMEMNHISTTVPTMLIMTA
jgi:hypothetical protein